jgi:hypothetical protein
MDVNGRQQRSGRGLAKRRQGDEAGSQLMLAQVM